MSGIAVTTPPFQAVSTSASCEGRSSLSRCQLQQDSVEELPKANHTGVEICVVRAPPSSLPVPLCKLKMSGDNLDNLWVSVSYLNLPSYPLSLALCRQPVTLESTETQHCAALLYKSRSNTADHDILSTVLRRPGE